MSSEDTPHWMAVRACSVLSASTKAEVGSSLGTLRCGREIQAHLTILRRRSMAPQLRTLPGGVRKNSPQELPVVAVPSGVIVA